MSDGLFVGRDEARPSDGEMRFYARAYSQGRTPEELFGRWEVYQAHAVLLAQGREAFHPEYGLDGRQLAAGALIAARRMALLLAEEPASSREILALKIHVVETMAQIGGEPAASHALTMIEAALKADAERLGLVLPWPGGARGRRH